MKKKYFGTDGIRGKANVGALTPDNVMRLGMAAGKYFIKNSSGRPSVVIGKDTRLSGYMIENALAAGFISVGMDVKHFGPLPTSGVSLMTRTMRADLGVMITASHNKFYDNGYKLFGPDGNKLSDEAEHAIEEISQEKWKEGLATSENLGRARRFEDVQARYIEIVKSTFPKRLDLSGLKIVIDCANGAAYKTAPETLWELGADEVIPIGITPNGVNINKGCGSTATDLMARTVVEQGAHLGIALDGDADRLIMCDEQGTIIDGDQLLGLIGTGWQKSGQLSKPGIVATVMSNLGLERYLAGQKLALHRTDVGDRHVAKRMRDEGYNVGGEQSGHLLMTDFSPTGDGTVAALQVLAEIQRRGQPASEVLKVFEAVPQMLKNVTYESGMPMKDKDVLAAIEDARLDLGNTGRVLVRASGTEPVIRVMAEGDDLSKVDRVTENIVKVIRKVAA